MTNSQIPRLVVGGRYFVEVVGESFYQPALQKITEKRPSVDKAMFVKAFVMLEPDNPKDENALRVVIANETVGYLSREDATEMRMAMAANKYNGAIETRAKIVGGFTLRNGETASYGVRLDLPMGDGDLDLNDLVEELAEALGQPVPKMRVSKTATVTTVTPDLVISAAKPEEKKRRGWFQWLLIVLGVVILGPLALGVVVAIIGGILQAVGILPAG